METLPARPVNSYSELDRAVCILVATVTSPPEASELLDIPIRTVYDWLAKSGGIAELKDNARTVLGHSMYGTALLVCKQLREKLVDMDTEQLIQALKALSAGAIAPLMAPNQQATAQAGAFLKIQFGDGPNAELIEVPRTSTQTPNPDTE